MPTPLEQAIVRTAAWFSMFETPATVFELWKWMLEPDRAYSLEEVHAVLDGDWLRERLVDQDGMWSLRSVEPRASTLGVDVATANSDGHAGCQHSVLTSGRRSRFLDASRKFKKLRRVAWLFRLIPGVVGVAAGNTLAWWNTRPDSDIDLLVVTRPGMIWLARLLVVTPFALLGKRPAEGGELVEPASAVDPFCFSFFVTTDALDFSPLRLERGDPYLAYWVRSLVPVLDRGGVFDRIIAENGWVDDVLPNAKSTGRMTTPDPSLDEGGETKRKTYVVVSFVERIARSIQLRRFPSKIRALMNVDSRVVVNDRVLKFHESDRRAEYRDRLNELCDSLEHNSPTPSSS